MERLFGCHSAVRRVLEYAFGRRPDFRRGKGRLGEGGGRRPRTAAEPPCVTQAKNPSGPRWKDFCLSATPERRAKAPPEKFFYFLQGRWRIRLKTMGECVIIMSMKNVPAPEKRAVEACGCAAVIDLGTFDGEHQP